MKIHEGKTDRGQSGLNRPLIFEQFLEHQNSGLNTAQQHNNQYPILKVLILGWVVVYDKYKTPFTSDPSHRIALVESRASRPEKNQQVQYGDSDKRKINECHSGRFLIMSICDSLLWMTI
jgi:hypothetical protein